MLEISINERTSYGSVDLAKLAISCFGAAECIDFVKLDVRKHIPGKEDMNRVPVTIHMTIPDERGKNLSEVEIYAKMFTCGYGGTGPHDLVELLRYTEVDFQEDDIYLESEICQSFRRK